jgi:hypothetical protein
MQHFGVDPAAVVANQNPKLVGSIFQFHFDIARAGMAKCIDQGFAANTIDIVTDGRSHWQGRTFDKNAKTDFLLYAQLLRDSRE